MSAKKTSERRAKKRRELAKRREKIRWELDSPIRRKSPGRRTIDRSRAPDSRKRTELLSSLTGICVLDPTGRVGYYDEQREFVVNDELTETLLDYTLEFLRTYQGDPDGSNYRLALICQTAKPRPWGRETLILEESVVRRIYFVSRQTTSGLTAFQKRNREASVYRGMELLLEWRDEAMPDIPVYFPVLYDRGTTLDVYRSIAGSDRYRDEMKAPVIDVLNLLSPIPVHRRNTVEVQELMRNVRGRIIKKELRKTQGFELIDDVNEYSMSMGSLSAFPFATGKTGTRRRGPTPGPPVVKKTKRPPAAQTANNAPARVAPARRFEAWLETPNRPVNIARLKKFQPFRNLGNRQLSVLAARSLVFKAPPGALLLDRGTGDRWNMYLLEGKVALEADDGRVEVIDAGTDQASIPIASAKPRQHAVRAVTSVSFLWINDDMIREK